MFLAYPDLGHNQNGPGEVYGYAPPFSTEFDFTNGTTSRAGYDGTGYLSNQGQVFGFDPSAPGVVLGPSILPMTGVPEDTDGNGASPQDVAAITPPLSFPASVPEPGSLLLLGAGIAFMLAIRRPVARIRSGRDHRRRTRYSITTSARGRGDSSSAPVSVISTLSMIRTPSRSCPMNRLGSTETTMPARSV